ncbi:MAG: polysaccharide lyase polysaccharide lyase family14 protein [Rhodocyclales bacterium]|nr:polysaccharide lyase polysaccharide lyase family14 protein [Rhodocyclales bacterium]
MYRSQTSSNPISTAFAIFATLAAIGISPRILAQPAPAGTDTSGAWTGNFDGFNTPAWGNAWGVAVPGDVFSFGQNDEGMSAFADPNSPDGHMVLKVSYKAHSTSRSGGGPLPDGGQFYQDLNKVGRPDLANANIIHLRYYLRLGDTSDTFDFGRGGKLPGLWGGAQGQESGCLGNANTSWSTRYMFRNGSNAEVYDYDPGHSSGNCGGNSYWGRWQADGKWHYVEQAVNRAAGSVSVWYDSVQVMRDQRIGSGYGAVPFRGVFFSTFYGGHSSNWGPGKDTASYFAKFAISTSYIGP